MRTSIFLLFGTSLLIIVAAFFIFQRIPKPDYTDKGQGIICEAPPSFPDYGIASGSGTLVKPVNFLTNSRAEIMREEILAATASGINFAASYLLVEVECGLSCQNHAIIDAQTGDIVHYGMRSTGGVSFRPDSSLLIVNPMGLNISRYYHLNNGALEYICEKQP